MRESSAEDEWRRHRFDEIAVMVNDRVDDPSEAGVEYYVGLEHLDPESLTIRRWGSPSGVEATKLRFRAGDIIFGRRRVYQRKLAVAAFDGICSAHAMVLRARPVVALPEFLPFFMQGDLFMNRAKEISVGSLSPTINWKTLAQEEFVLPPLAEQRRIARTLAAHDLTKEAHLRLRESTSELRRALLEGYFPSEVEDSSRVAMRTFLDEGQLKLQTGPFGTVLAASAYTATGWPIVNPTHIRNGEIVHVDGPCVDEATARRLQNYRMRAGDILLARKGEIDKATLVSERETGWIVGSDCILLRTSGESLAPEYLLLFMQSPSTGKTLRSLAHGTVMPGLNEGMLARLEVPLRSMDEQLEAIRLVRELDSAVSALVERLDGIDRVRRDVLALSLRSDRPEVG
jgi:type I restriction enzyme, S subunit